MRVLMIALLLSITGCVPKYTCEEAPRHCKTCMTGSVGYRTIPVNIIDTQLPKECYLVFDIDDVIKVTPSEDPVVDMQSMVSEYKNSADKILFRNEQIKECKGAILKRDALNKSIKTDYCKQFKMEYSFIKDICE